MMIEEVHGLHATNISLHNRFSTLIAKAPAQQRNMARRQNRRILELELLKQKLQQTRKLLMQNRKRNRQRRYSEGSVASNTSMRRSNSVSNLSVRSARSNQGFHNNLSRAASFTSLNTDLQRGWRGLGFRGAGLGRYRGNNVRQYNLRSGANNNVRYRLGQIRQIQERIYRGKTRGRGVARGTARGMSRGMARGTTRGVTRGGARGRGRGMARGGTKRNPNFNTKALPTKEELDQQLDQYMASCRSVLDKELDEYRSQSMAMDLN